jgi:hypothetical protein
MGAHPGSKSQKSHDLATMNQLLGISEYAGKGLRKGDILTQFVVNSILPHLGFYLDLKDVERARGVCNHPPFPSVLKRCRESRARFTKSHANTRHGGMDRIDLHALAAMRVSDILLWATTVNKRFRSPSPGAKVVYPHFTEKDKAVRLRIATDVLRAIQQNRKGHMRLGPKSKKVWPHKEVQDSMRKWKEDPNTVNFSDLDMNVKTQWRPFEIRELERSREAAGEEQEETTTPGLDVEMVVDADDANAEDKDEEMSMDGDDCNNVDAEDESDSEEYGEDEDDEDDSEYEP